MFSNGDPWDKNLIQRRNANILCLYRLQQKRGHSQSPMSVKGAEDWGSQRETRGAGRCTRAGLFSPFSSTKTLIGRAESWRDHIFHTSWRRASQTRVVLRMEHSVPLTRVGLCTTGEEAYRSIFLLFSVVWPYHLYGNDMLFGWLLLVSKICMVQISFKMVYSRTISMANYL